MTHYERIRVMLTTGQAARLLDVHVTTVQRWCDCGKIKSYRIGPRGERMLLQEDIDRILAGENTQHTLETLRTQ